MFLSFLVVSQFSAAYDVLLHVTNSECNEESCYLMRVTVSAFLVSPHLFSLFFVLLAVAQGAAPLFSSISFVLNKNNVNLASDGGNLRKISVLWFVWNLSFSFAFFFLPK